MEHHFGSLALDFDRSTWEKALEWGKDGRREGREEEGFMEKECVD
jgi:hypothetical protein